MKKLMTSLLVVLLCGIGFLWADGGATITGNLSCSKPGGGQPDAVGLSGTVTLWKDGAATEYKDADASSAFTITGVPAGSYTAKFEGTYKGSACAGSSTVTVSEGAVNNNATLSCNITASLSSTSGSTTVSMSVMVGADVAYYGSMQFQGIAGATVICKQGENVIETQTTGSDWSNKGFATFTHITAGETYSFSVTASGYKDTTVTNVTGMANNANERSAFKIGMREAFVTVSGTLKWSGETVTAFPEGMGLVFRSNNSNYIAEMGENGSYTVNCKSGTATLYVTDVNAASDYSLNYIRPSKNYAVTVPENGTLTITGNAETLTQNIEINKTAASAIVMTNPDDEIGDSDLKMTSADNTNIRPTVNNGTFTFSGLTAGTYTLMLDHFGLKIKEGKATVTIAENLEDVTVTLETEAAPGTVKFKGTITYRDKTLEEDNQLKGLTGAIVSLYHAKADAATESFILDVDAVGTATVAEDGTWSMSPEIVGGYYIASVTRDDILTTYSSRQTVTSARDLDVEFNSPKMIWISGEVTNHADLSNVELEWTGENSYSLSFMSEYDPTTGKYYAYVPGAAPVPGTYTLNLRASNSEGLLMTASGEATIDSDKKAVTQNLTAVKDEDKGYMTVTYKYRNAVKDTTVAGLDVSVFLNDGTEDGEYLAHLTTDANGTVKYLVDKDKTYILKTEATPYSSGYAATKVNVNGFVTVGDKLQPNDTTIFLEALPIQTWVKLTGCVILPKGVAKLSDLGEDFYIAVRTRRDLNVMTSAITNDNTYTIDSIPVAVNGYMPVFLAQTGGKPNAYGTEVPYNYAIDYTTLFESTGSAYKTEEKNFTIQKIACNVSGSVSPAKTGEATLTKQGDAEPTYKANIAGAGAYKFQGVPAGTYTLNVNCAGYAPATRDVTVEATLADVTVPAITLESAPLTVEVGGDLTASRNGKTYYFEGAELAIYDGDEKLAESTVPEGSMGTFSFTFTSTIGTTVRFTMKHPSIKDVSKEYKVTSDKLTINASDLNYEFIESGNDDYVVMTGFKAEWNADASGLNLSWTWPEGADGKIKKITLRRKLSGETGNGVELTTWEATGDNPHDNSYTFAAAELPVAYADTVTVSTSYAYLFEILYAAGLHRESVWFTADMRDGDRYKLTYTVNDDKMGTISSYMQPEGEYQENDPITVTATAKPGYKFVEFLKNDQKLTEAELGRITLLGSDRDSVAIFGFNMPAEDLTVKAVFAAKDPDATVEYTVTLVSSNEAWGTVSGGGKFKEGTEIEVKATVTDAAKYKFVAWKEGDKEVSKDATYKFKVEKDITLTAVFEEPTANENLKATRWAIFAEDGAIVIKGINGDRYDIYDLNGRLSGSALCTGAEIRLGVAKSKLYIVRRLGADGSFDAKKIVVR